MRQVRVGVVGAGGVAQVVHLPILRRLPDLEVAGVIDVQAEKAATIAARFEIEGVGRDLEALEEFGSLDAVVVCTPTDTHEELVIACLERGLHVLCERPLTRDSDSAARMLTAARRAERQLMVAMNQRYRLDVRAIRQFVASGELGDVFFARSTWLNQRHRKPTRGWRRDPDRAGGGVLMDLGVPALDLALWTLGTPLVERVTARFHGLDGVEGSAIALLSLEGGGTISVEATWELMEDRDRNSLTVLGTRGTAGTSPFRVLKELETGLADVTPPLDVATAQLYTAAYRQEWADFLRRVRGETPLEEEVDQVELLRIVEACYASARDGREIAIGHDTAG